MVTKEFLEGNLDKVKNKSYDLSIVTYALHLLGSNLANESLEALERLATVEGLSLPTE